jgi:hypothetical protein
VKTREQLKAFIYRWPRVNARSDRTNVGARWQTDVEMLAGYRFYKSVWSSSLCTRAEALTNLSEPYHDYNRNLMRTGYLSLQRQRRFA